MEGKSDKNRIKLPLKPKLWEILLYIIWASLFFYLSEEHVKKLSLLYFMILSIGTACLLIGIQQLRVHKEQHLEGKEHKICIQNAIILLVVSALLLVAVALE